MTRPNFTEEFKIDAAYPRLSATSETSKLHTQNTQSSVLDLGPSQNHHDRGRNSMDYFGNIIYRTRWVWIKQMCPQTPLPSTYRSLNMICWTA